MRGDRNFLPAMTTAFSFWKSFPARSSRKASFPFWDSVIPHEAIPPITPAPSMLAVKTSLSMLAGSFDKATR